MNIVSQRYTALVNGGVFVYVPKNVVVEHPVQYVVLHDDENASFYNHVIIVTEESAEVTYVENYLSNASGEGNQLNIISGSDCWCKFKYHIWLSGLYG